MNVPAGYKQTEVGVIPEDWGVQSLGILTDSNRPISYGIVQTGPNVANGVRCLRVLDIENGRINKSDLITTTREISTSYKRTILKAGDLVMPLRGKVGEVGAVDEDLAGSNLTRGVALIAIRSEWSGSFCRQFIAAPSTRGRLEQSMNGSALQEIPIAALRAFKIALPPTKAEQEAIAEALSAADALIESLDQLIAKKRQIKQGTMQELLTGQRRLPGFSGEWKVKTFDELFIFSGGYSASRDQLSIKGHCYLHYGDIHGAKKTYVDTRADYQSIPKLEISLKRVSPNSLLKDGDVVFVDASEDADGASRHIVVVNKDNYPFISGLHTIVAKSKTDELAHNYRRYCFQTSAIRQQFLFYAVGTKVSGISKANISKLVLPIPSVPEQTAIATVLSDMDTELAALQAQITKARHIKQGMMQELLTGRIRLL